MAERPVASAELGFFSVEDYFTQRDEVKKRQHAIAFDHECTVHASKKEQKADQILQLLKKRDNLRVYMAAEPRVGYGGQRHPRFAGDHFLSNESLIEQTDVFRVAHHMPKGAHLHIHFNACLDPSVLLEVAKNMDRMFITSDLPLILDHSSFNYDRCEIQFSLLPPEKERPGNLFSATYQPRQTMPFKQFLNEFSSHNPHISVDEWLERKLLFDEEEAHNKLQTCSG